jgi:hypothetical protein
MQRYFEALQIERAECYRIAERARCQGLDPSPRVEIPSANRLIEEFDLSPYVIQRVKLMETFFDTTFRDDVRRLESF